MKITTLLLILWTSKIALAQPAPDLPPPEIPKKDSTPAISACEAPAAAFLPTGYIFNALLPDAVYSYNLTAPVVALLEEDVKFRDQLVLPKKTKLVGTASTLHTLDRVNITWSLAVLPDGCELALAAIALSAEDGSAGIKGKLEEHKGSIAAHIALRSLLSAGTNAATMLSPVEGAVASGLANETNQQIVEDLSKVKSYESVYVRERTPIRVFVLRRFLRHG